MAESAIISLKRPGFPVESFDESSYRTTIEYVGLVVDLLAASPAMATVWGSYPGVVVSDALERFENSLYGLLTVVCERKFEPGNGDPSSAAGTKMENETTYEIDWIDVQLTLYEHPAFSEGGANALTEEDVLQIESWEKNPFIEYRKDFIFKADGNYEDGVSSADPTLSPNAQVFAKGILKGIEFYTAKLPVAIRSDTWVAGPPPRGSAGQKETPTGFPNLPTGYEWIRNSERSLRAGGQSTWAQTTEWQGVKKVLVDSDEIFWT